ncbi:DUF4142 domain-containing protein [Acidisoma sp. C75]
MRNAAPFRTRWLLSSMIGAGLLLSSGAAALAQAVPGENPTAPAGPANGAATQVIQMKPGQEAGTASVLPADTGPNPAASVRDSRFVTHASAINQAEIMLGKLAERRGQTAQEQSYGQMLVQDHTQSEMALKGIADASMLPLAKQPGPMMRSVYKELASAPAGSFDAMFNRIAVRGHQEAIHLYRMEAHSGQNPALRQFAMKSLPVLQAHLQTAESMMPAGSTAQAGMTGAMGQGGMSQPNMSQPGTGQAMGRMPVAGVQGARAQAQAAMGAPISGNPDNSADQLNARVLSVTGQQS